MVVLLNRKVKSMERKVHLVNKRPPKPKMLRVVGYARVSSGKDAMLHSLASQIDYFQNLIKNHAGWEFCGVFADEPVTGTKEERPQFQKILEKCRNHEIDLIVTKAISRFARNTVTLLETVRELKILGIDVWFEKENLHSISGDGELMLSILASFAQEESKSVSDNMKWRIQTNFKEGMPWNATLLGYRYENGVLIVEPEEAEVVRFIFDSYLDGAGTQKIANELNAQGKITRKGCKWHKNSVIKILCNYTYTGNLLLQTTFLENHITKKAMKNEGQLPKYHVEDAHEAIIPMEQYLAVQSEMNRRTAEYSRNNGKKQVYPFTGKLICDCCGKHYQRKKTAAGYVWICSTFNREGKSACPSRQIPETTLEKLSAEVLGVAEFNAEIFAEQIENIDICTNCVVKFHFKDSHEETKHWQVRSRSESWTAEMKEKARKKSCQE